MPSSNCYGVDEDADPVATAYEREYVLVPSSLVIWLWRTVSFFIEGKAYGGGMTPYGVNGDSDPSMNQALQTAVGNIGHA